VGDSLCYRDTRVQNFFGALTRIRASIRVGRDATRTRHAAAVSGQLRSSSAVRRPPVVRQELCSCTRRSPGARRAAATAIVPLGARLGTPRRD